MGHGAAERIIPTWVCYLFSIATDSNIIAAKTDDSSEDSDGWR